MNSFDRKMSGLVGVAAATLLTFALIGCDAKQVQVAKAACQFDATTNNLYNLQTKAPVAVAQAQQICSTINSIPVAPAAQ